MVDIRLRTLLLSLGDPAEHDYHCRFPLLGSEEISDVLIKFGP